MNGKMSYNWQSAATPQGRERLKELLDGGLVVVTRYDGCYPESGRATIGGYCLHKGVMVWKSQWDDENSTWWRGLEFLDPNPAPVVDEWVSVNDRLPMKETVVLFANSDDKWVDMGEIRSDGKWYNFWDTSDDCCECQPTHWMPLPKAPMSLTKGRAGE